MELQAPKTNLLTPKRYQLKKEAVQVIYSGHPWLFRTHLSTAAEVFPNGQWLRLYDSKNQIVGYGIYASEGQIGIRVLKRGEAMNGQAWLCKMLEKAWGKRQGWILDHGYQGVRLINGESDGIPGVVLDQYGDYAVLQTYHSSVDAIGRFCAGWFRQKRNLKGILWKFPVKRKNPGKEPEKKDRVLFGTIPPSITFPEGRLNLTVELLAGQKSGAFLDLRALRQWLSVQDLAGKRVLNLFSYTGTLGLACEAAGAKEIWNVDVSEGALQAAKKHHAVDESKHRFIKADIFEWLPKLALEEKFDLIIVDPPMMASRKEQVPLALRTYKKLYKEVVKHLPPTGKVIGCCCTSRITRKVFDKEVAEALGSTLKRKGILQPEPDHPVGFREADYLKINIYG